MWVPWLTPSLASEPWWHKWWRRKRWQRRSWQQRVPCGQTLLLQLAHPHLLLACHLPWGQTLQLLFVSPHLLKNYSMDLLHKWRWSQAVFDFVTSVGQQRRLERRVSWQSERGMYEAPLGGAGENACYYLEVWSSKISSRQGDIHHCTMRKL